MTIGIDIDDTLTDTSAFANEILKSWGKYPNIEDYHLLSKEQYKDFIMEKGSFIHANVPLKENVLEVLERFRSKGDRLVVITARGYGDYYFLIEVAKDYFEKHELYFDKVLFAHYRTDKAALEEKVDVFIDDKEYILDSIRKKGIRTLRFANTSLESKHEVVTSWLEVEGKIEEMR